MRVVAIVLAIALGACSPGLPPSAMPRPVGEDLLGLVPSGAELVVDVDVQQLRTWDEIERVLALLPPAGRERLEKLGPHWMGDIDEIVVGAWRSESRTQSVMVMRCELDDTKLPALLDGTVTRGEMGGHVMFQAGLEAAVRIGPRLVAVGSPVEIRRVTEVARGEEHGFREARGDRLLREALGKAPGARSGKPALIGAAVSGPLLTDRFEAAGLAGRGPGSVAFALAVGDGIDAVVILALGSPAEAVSLRGELDRALRDLKERPIIRILGLQGALELVSVVRDRDLRIAYRLAGGRLSGYVDRLDHAKKALEAARATPPADVTSPAK